MKLASSTLQRLAPLSLAALLASCGGGGDSSGTPVTDPPTVSSVTASAAKFSGTLTISIVGTNLLNGISVTSAGCSGMTRDSISAQAAASYTCTVSAVGAQSISVTRNSDGAVLGSATYTIAQPQVTMAVSNGTTVTGTLTVNLAADKTPHTVANFLSYVNAHQYDGVVFHRVSPGFVIQGGGYASPVTTTALPAHIATAAPIALEVNKGLSNTQWTIAMARTSDPNSATSEFFINLANNASILDPSGSSAGYAVFGDVTASSALVQAMAAAPCVQPAWLSPGECVPIPNLVIALAAQTQ